MVEEKSKQKSSRTIQQKLSAEFSKHLKPVFQWYEERAPRERYLILGAIAIACLIGIERVYSVTSATFSQQSARLNDIEDKLGKIAVLLHNYNRYESRRKVAEQRFLDAGSYSAHYAHLEGVITRKARIDEGKYRINKGAGESFIGDQFLRVPFSVNFTRVEPGELATFLKEISSDKERPAILLKLSVSTRGNYLQAEVGLDLVTRRT